MALRKSSPFLLAMLATAAVAAPAWAEDYAVNYMSHSDSITIGLGDAPTSNIIIQHPTPWPSYVNDTNIRTPARQGVGALERMFQRYEPGSSSSPSTVINIGSSGSN